MDDQIVNGAGTLDDPTTDLVGILDTPGTLAQPFTTSLIETTRKAITQLEDKPRR